MKLRELAKYPVEIMEQEFLYEQAYQNYLFNLHMEYQQKAWEAQQGYLTREQPKQDAPQTGVRNDGGVY